MESCAAIWKKSRTRLFLTSKIGNFVCLLEGNWRPVVLEASGGETVMFRPVVVSAGTTSVLGSVLTFKIVKAYVLSLTDSKSTYPTLLT